MTLNECAAVIRGMNRKEQEAWERTRMLMYAVVQVNSRDHLTPDALLPFPWDEDREPIEINMDEVNELRQRAKKFEYECCYCLTGVYYSLICRLFEKIYV